MSELLIIIAGVIYGVMTLGFVVSRLVRNTSVIDLFWGVGFFMTALVMFLLKPISLAHFMVSFLMAAAGLRLSVFFYFTRIKVGKRDPRYTALEKNWTRFPFLQVLGHFYFQGVFQVLLCLVLIPIYMSEMFFMTPLKGVAVLVFAAAFLGQWVADWQLHRFKTSGSSGVCRRGLWRYSRHPNYFFETVMWISLAVMATGLPYQGLAWVSPITIWVITRYMTGPYTERLSKEKRPEEYGAYQRDVPYMIPFIDFKLKKG